MIHQPFAIRPPFFSGLLGGFHLDVVRTVRSARHGRPEGLHYVEMENQYEERVARNNTRRCNEEDAGSTDSP